MCEREREAVGEITFINSHNRGAHEHFNERIATNDRWGKARTVMLTTVMERREDATRLLSRRPPLVAHVRNPPHTIPTQ